MRLDAIAVRVDDEGRIAAPAAVSARPNGHYPIANRRWRLPRRRKLLGHFKPNECSNHDPAGPKPKFVPKILKR